MNDCVIDKNHSQFTIHNYLLPQHILSPGERGHSGGKPNRSDGQQGGVSNFVGTGPDIQQFTHVGMNRALLVTANGNAQFYQAARLFI